MRRGRCAAVWRGLHGIVLHHAHGLRMAMAKTRGIKPLKVVVVIFLKPGDFLMVNLAVFLGCHDIIILHHMSSYIPISRNAYIMR